MPLGGTVNQSSVVQLAAGQLTRVDGLSVELHRPADSPPFVLLLWPPKPSVIAPNPKALADLAAAMVRVTADAQTHLATLRRR
jgi:hypothetical protein